MNIRSILRLFRSPHLPAQIAVMQDLRTYSRVNFLYAALQSGLLKALNTPSTKQELARNLNVQRPDLLDAFLSAGVSSGELSVRNGRYRIRGIRSNALLNQTNDPIAAVIEEFVTYHGSVYRHLPERLSGAPLGDYLAGTGNLIARSSRALEPFMVDFVKGAAKRNQPMRLLEVGCGSGVYIRYAAEANPQLTGVGVDMQQDVVEQATANLAEWGVANRFKVTLADVRTLPDDLGGPFDLVTLYNNVYYFPVEERTILFRTLRSLLTPSGALAIVSSMRGKGATPITSDFDLILRSTEGCAPLPRLDEIKKQLHASGFSDVSATKLIPTEPFYGVIAHSP